MSELKLPKFETEAEEAAWWFEHREEVGLEMVKAIREGRVGEGSRARQERRMREAVEHVSAA